MTRDYAKEAVFVTRSVCLGNIQDYSEWIESLSKSLGRYCNLLVSLPDFETDAEWACACAYASLEKTMKDVEEAHKKIKIKREQAEIRKARQLLEATE